MARDGAGSVQDAAHTNPPIPYRNPFVRVFTQKSNSLTSGQWSHRLRPRCCILKAVASGRSGGDWTQASVTLAAPDTTEHILLCSQPKGQQAMKQETGNCPSTVICEAISLVSNAIARRQVLRQSRRWCRDSARTPSTAFLCAVLYSPTKQQSTRAKIYIHLRNKTLCHYSFKTQRCDNPSTWIVNYSTVKSGRKNLSDRSTTSPRSRQFCWFRGKPGRELGRGDD